MDVHIRKEHRKGIRTSRNWVRFDASAGAATLCGAPVTDKDLTVKSARAKGNAGWVTCQKCLTELERLAR